MSENTNLVKQWAKNMLEDADNALKTIWSDSKRAYGYISEIKGCCESIIAAMEATEDHRCPTCKNWNLQKREYPCISCKFQSFSPNDLWEGNI